MAQSRLRQPFRNSTEPGISKSGAKSNAHFYAAIVTLLLADIAFLSIAALAGFLFDASFIAEDVAAEMATAEAGIALWVPITFIAIATVCLKLIDAQQPRVRGVSLREWGQTIGIVSFASLIAWGMSEVASPGSLSAQVAVAVWAAAILILPVGRAMTRQALLARGIGCKRIVVVGDINKAMPVIKQLSKNGAQYRVAGLVSPGSRVNMSKETSGIAMQELSALPEVLKKEQATEVLIAVSNGQYAAVRDAVRSAAPSDTTVHVALNPLLDEPAQGEPEMVQGVPAVRFKGRTLSWQYETIKRWFDFAAAFVILLLLSPLMAIIAIAVKLDSPGPLLFKQARIGRHGRPFGMYKFRSMKINAEAMLPDLMKHNEASGHMFKMRNDPRITRVGKVIRKLSLDELPQLFNVLNGTMSLVGPRPPLPQEVQQYEEWHYQRLDGVPGITGLWQVNRGPVLDFNEMVTFDLEYLRTWSLKNDVVILLKTVPVVITGRGAY